MHNDRPSKMTCSVSATANKAEQLNKDSPLVKLPPELKKHIFEALAASLAEDGLLEKGVRPEDIDHENMGLMHHIFNLFFHQPALLKYRLDNPGSAKDILDQYGCLCKDLREYAVSTYYSHCLLVLTAVEEPSWVEQWRQGTTPLLTAETWDRYGKIYIRVRMPNTSSSPDDTATADDVSIPDTIALAGGLHQTQYAIELPPRYIRPYVRHIRFILFAPAGSVDIADSTIHGMMFPTSMPREAFIQDVRYDDEENEWLAPVLKLYSGYGFHKAARVKVSIKVKFGHWTAAGVLEMQLWVMEVLRSNEDVAKALDEGKMELDWSGIDWEDLQG